MNSLQKYLITDPIYYQNFSDTLRRAIELHEPDFICFRDKTSTNIEFIASEFLAIAKSFSICNVFINTDIQLAQKLGYDGVHLTSTQLEQQTSTLKVIASTHNQEEIERAIANGIQTITYSPIFETPNKGKHVGIKGLKNVVQSYPQLRIFALGGIVSQKEVDVLQEAKPFGFASIRYFI